MLSSYYKGFRLVLNKAMWSVISIAEPWVTEHPLADCLDKVIVGKQKQMVDRRQVWRKGSKMSASNLVRGCEQQSLKDGCRYV